MNPFIGLLSWGLGPPLLAACGAGVAAALRRRTHADWLLLAFLVGAYLTVANSHVQFIRYAYPMAPVLAVLAARALVSMPRDLTNHRFAKPAADAALVIVLVTTALYGVAFAGIFRSTDTRLLAEQWIAENIPLGATVGMDGPDPFSDPFVDPERYRLNILPLYSLYYDSAPRVYSGWGPVTLLLGSRVAPADRPQLTEDELSIWVREHLKSDYLVLSDRLSEQVERTGDGFESIREYYASLDAGSADFELVKEFRSEPRLWRFSIDDSGAEPTLKIFDHPTIRIYKRRTQ